MSMLGKTLIKVSGNRFIQSVQESPHGVAAAVLALLLCLIPFLPNKAYSETWVVHPTYRGYTAPVKVGDMADTQDIVAWKFLGDYGHDTPEKLRAASEEVLKNTGEIPQFHRVEVTGILATDNDDTAVETDLFDKRIKFSSLNQVRAEPRYEKLWNRTKDLLHDVTNTGKSENGETTPYIKELFKDLKDATVEEIVAHSAGTEAVYAAILNGVIRPPKRLIIIGVLDNNEGKWRLLQKYTGTEVHVVRFETDNMERLGELAKWATKSITEKPLPNDVGALSRVWDYACWDRKANCGSQRNMDKFHYNIHANPPPDDDNLLPRKLVQALRPIGDHDRDLYYKYLFKTGVITTTIDDLRKQDDKAIEDYYNRSLADAMEEARGLIAEARKLAQNGPGEKVVYAPLDAYGHPIVVERKAPVPPDRKPWKLLTADDILRIVQRACEHPGSITAEELENNMWLIDDFDHYRPGMGDRLTGCARDFWKAIERARAENVNCSISLKADGINGVAQKLVAWYARPPTPAPAPPSSPNGNNPPSRDHDDSNHSIDLSRAIRVVGRLTSPF